MDVKHFLAFLGVFVGVTEALESNSYCTQNPNQGPPLPVERSFKAEVAGKLVEEKMSVSVIQTVSQQANKSSIFWTQADQHHFVIHDFTKQTTLAGFGAQCSYVNQTDVMARLTLLSSQVLTGEAEYINETNVRGVPADYWRKCVTWPGLANFTLDIYVTDNDVYWNMPSVRPWVPIRLVARGVKFQKGQEVNFHHVYDYIRFENFVGDKFSASLEPPTGVLCPDRSTNVPKLNLPASLSFSRETSVLTAEYVDYATIYFDTLDKLYRNDYKDGLVPMRVIGDFKEGVVYKIDTLADTCQVLPINQMGGAQYKGQSLDINVPFTFDENGYVRMRSTEEYFLASGNFTYEGERQVRGVAGQVYSTQVPNYKGNPGLTLVSLYFSKEGIEMYNTRGLNNLMEKQLMRVTTTNKQAIMNSEIYNVDPEPTPKYSPFDISRCFDDSSQIRFVMTFDSGDLEKKEFYSFGKLVQRDIVQMAEISSLRVHWQEVTVIDGQVRLTGKLLDRPPDYARFTKTSGKKQDSSVLSATLKATTFSHPSLTPSLCAAYCAKERSPSPLPQPLDTMRACDSFDLCAGDQVTCYFYQQINDSRYHRLVQDANCDHYQAAVPGSSPRTLDKAWNKLRTVVSAGQLQIPILKNALEPSSVTRFTAVSLTDLHPGSRDHRMQISPRYIYDEVPGVKMNNPKVVQPGISIDSCAKMCTDSLTFQCLTFSYCEVTTTCTLYDTERKTDGATLPATAGCNTFSRSYMKSFYQVPNTDLPSGTKVIGQVPDEESCAYQCLNTTDLICKSFQYCSADGGTCFLSGYHIFGKPHGDIKKVTGCTHYSRKSLSYFNALPNKITNYAVIITVTTVSPEQCARICMRDTSYDCTMFQYCDSQSTCQLIDTSAAASPNGDNTMKLLDQPGCSTFSRKAGPPALKRTGRSTSEGYSSGSMAGVGIGMTVLGSLLCLIGVAIFARARKGQELWNAPKDIDMARLDSNAK